MSLDQDLTELYGVSTTRLNEVVKRNPDRFPEDLAFRLRAVEMLVYVAPAFVRLRAVLASNAELSRSLAVLEKSVATLDADMRRQFDEAYAAIRALMMPPEAKRRSIGFTADLEEPD